MKRKLASRLTPTNTISVEGDVWTMEVKMGWKTISHSFKLGEQFEENTPAGNFKVNHVNNLIWVWICFYGMNAFTLPANIFKYCMTKKYKMRNKIGF